MGSQKNRKRLDTTDGTDDDWVEGLARVYSEVIPKGYKTMNQLAEEYKISKSRLTYILQQNVDKGVIDKKKVFIHGRVHNCYKIKKPLH